MSESDHEVEGTVPLLYTTEEDALSLNPQTQRRQRLPLRRFLQRAREQFQRRQFALPRTTYDVEQPEPKQPNRRERNVSKRSITRFCSFRTSLVFQIIIFLALCVLLFGILAIEAVINRDAGFFLATNLFLESFFDIEPSQNPRIASTGSLSNFTKGIFPIPCHSHNDYWRTTPLFDAIRTGCTSVEADVWLFHHELYVGHTVASLTHDRTLNSMYINSLVDLLDSANPDLPRTKQNLHDADKPRGIFYEDPDQTLVLLIDFKTDGRKTFPIVQQQLEPLRRKNYLTYWDGSTLHSGAITVVGTGNTPFELIDANSTYRDIFFDAPLADREEEEQQQQNSKDEVNHSSLSSSKSEKYNPYNSYYASASLRAAVGPVTGNSISPQQLEEIRAQIHRAKERGLQVRYWDTPAKPLGLRNEIWRILLHEGVDMLNVDDLDDAAEEIHKWKRKHEHDQ